jgi:hypothetical protein
MTKKAMKRDESQWFFSKKVHDFAKYDIGYAN